MITVKKPSSKSRIRAPIRPKINLEISGDFLIGIGTERILARELIAHRREAFIIDDLDEIAKSAFYIETL